MAAPILDLRNIDKSFGFIDVLYDISLAVSAGEVLCLLGDNGAGKSTLIKTLSGVHKPTSGSVVMDGKPVEFASPREVGDLGIATVPQFGGTFPLMSIGRCFFCYREAFAPEIGAFVDAVEQGEAPKAGFEDGRKALTLAEAALRSANEGDRSIDVPGSPGPRRRRAVRGG